MAEVFCRHLEISVKKMLKNERPENRAHRESRGGRVYLQMHVTPSPHPWMLIFMGMTGLNIFFRKSPPGNATERALKKVRLSESRFSIREKYNSKNRDSLEMRCSTNKKAP